MAVKELKLRMIKLLKKTHYTAEETRKRPAKSTKPGLHGYRSGWSGRAPEVWKYERLELRF
jgi:hypothetical protein